jgi:oxygen-dependent protoporphyrinogen oxidase
LSEPIRRIGIIGGGISGLAAAYELARGSEGRSEFVLFEAAARLGGIVDTVREAGFTIEGGPDSWIADKPWARELARELGLDGEIICSNDLLKRTYIAANGGLTPMPDGMRMMVPTRWEPLLHSPLFTWEAKLAYVREPRRAAELRDASLAARGPDADESVAEFVRRHFGPEVAEKIAGPLLSGIVGGDIGRLSARAALAHFVQMEAQHGSLIAALQQTDRAGTSFSTLVRGLGSLIDAISARIPASAIRLSAPVTAVSFDGEHWTVHWNGNSERFSAVLLATSLDATRILLRSIGREAATMAASLLPIEASSAVLAALCFEAPAKERLRIPRGFGFLVPQRGSLESSNDRLLACTFVDQKFAHRAPEGAVQLRAFFGGSSAESLLGRSDSHIAETALRRLSAVLGRLPDPQLAVVRRWPRSLPQYEVGHLSRMAALEHNIGQLSGIALLGNAYRGVGLPDLIRDARAAARKLISS